MKLIFDVLHLYYLPQYLPVYKELVKRNVDVEFVFYQQIDEELNQVCQKIIKDEGLNVTWVENWNEALNLYLDKAAQWIVFGNKVSDLDAIHEVSKTVLMQHGIGPKQCYYQVSENLTTVRFIEGEHRLNRLLGLYPNGNFVDTGYAKLDAAFTEQNTLDLVSLGLDPTKKTILYAPTFYPSSIECFAKSFAKEFADYNIILKPHFFSLTKAKYKKQRNRLNLWAKENNVYLAQVEDYNLMPFMAIADVMLSDASSAIFEFAALEKPVVWCDFYKLRWSYRGPFKFRFNKRVDSDIEYFNKVAYKATEYSNVKQQVETALQQGTKNTHLIEELAGVVDGKCSERIVSYLVENQ